MKNMEFVIKSSSDKQFDNFFRSLCDLDNTNYDYYLTDSSKKLMEEGTCILFLLSEELYIIMIKRAISLCILNPFSVECEWHSISPYSCYEDDEGWELIDSNGKKMRFYQE